MGALAPGNSIGSVTINTLDMSAGTYQVELQGSSADSVNVTGTATFAGGTITPVPLSPSLSGSPYTILTAGTLVGTPTLSTSTIGRMTFGLDLSTANTIKLTQSGSFASLVWNNALGGGDGTTWDIQNNKNWNNAGVGDQYFESDSVLFNDNNNGQYNVNIATTVSPFAMTVDNSTADYTIGGAAIAGSTGLAKTGSKVVTLTGANTFSGAVSISGGGAVSISTSSGLGNAAATNNLALSGGGRLQSTGAAVDLGTTRTIAVGAGGGGIDVTGTNTLTVSGVVSGGAGNALTKTGTGTVVLSAANSGFAGGLVVSNGAARLSNVNAGGTGAITVNTGATLVYVGVNPTNCAQPRRRHVWSDGEHQPDDDERQRRGGHVVDDSPRGPTKLASRCGGCVRNQHYGHIERQRRPCGALEWAGQQSRRRQRLPVAWHRRKHVQRRNNVWQQREERDSDIGGRSV